MKENIIQPTVGSPHYIMTKVHDCDFKVRKFELQFHYYLHFWTNALEKSMNPLFPQLWVK